MLYIAKPPNFSYTSSAVNMWKMNQFHTHSQKKQNPAKKFIKSSQIERRRKRERRLGSIDGGEGEIVQQRQRRDRVTEARSSDVGVGLVWSSLFFLSLSLSSRVVRKWWNDLDDRWLGSTRVGLNDRSCAIVLLRCDLLAPTSAIFLLFLSLSLSLFYFPRLEVIWSENENENHFPLFWLYFSVN